MPTAPKMGLTEWIMLLVLSIVWGAAFLFYKLLDDAGVPPFTIVLGRVAAAALALIPVVLLTRRAVPRTARVWLAFFALGAINNVVPFTLIVLGEKHIDSGLASIFNATTPMFAALTAHAFTREKLTRNKVAGIAIGLLGVVLLIGPSALRGFDVTSRSQVECIGAAVAYGFGVVFARRFSAMGIDSLVTAAGQLCASAMLTLPIVVAFEHPWTLGALPAFAWWAWAGLALPSTALAFVLYFRILATGGATNAASVTFLVPVSAVLLGTLVLGEHLTTTTVAGMVLIFCGLAAIDGRIIALVRRTPVNRIA